MRANITSRQFHALHGALLIAFGLDEMALLLLKHRLRLEDLTGAATRELAFGELIDACERREVLPDFVMWASEARPQDSELRGLTEEIRIMTRTSPLQKRRDSLIALLDQAKISDASIHDAYRRFAPAGRENELQAFPAAHAAAVAVYTLADATQREGRYPVIELAIHFQNLVDAVTREKLEQWVNDAFAVHGVNEQARDAVAKRVETGEEPYHFYLQFIVERLRHPGETVYDMEVRRQKVMHSPRVVLEPESIKSYTPVNADKVFELVREHVGGHEAERAHVKSFTIEMVLDHRDLALPTDQIIPDPLAPIALGAECDVLLRSWDRHFGSRHAALQRIWREVWTTHATQPRLCDVEFFDHLTFRARLKAENVSCLLVDFVPPAAQYTEDGPIWTMLTGGTPVAVWARPDMSEELLPAFSEFLRDLEGERREDWKEHVRASRLAAAGTRNRHFGRHLCFLFDDGNRPLINEGFDQ